jgi:hypothetical protein
MRRILGLRVRGTGFVLTSSGLLVMSLNAFAQHTYYISKSLGSNSNTSTQAQSKSTPWASLPGMASCKSNCSSYTPVAGDQFVLYGGDTWGASDLGVEWQWGGTSSSPIYVGVDRTWYNSGLCGASWCRPIFNAGHAATTQGSDMFINVYTNANWTIFDNIEFTGQDGNGAYIYETAPNIEIKNMYMHGWATGSNNSGGCVQGKGAVDGSSFHDSVCDGIDTNRNFFQGVYQSMPLVYNLYIRYVVSGLLGNFNIVHDVTVENPVISCCGDHANSIFNFGPYSGNIIIMYNNVVRHTTACSGCVNMWFDGNTGANSSLVSYGFNNVLYDLNPSNIFITGGHPPGPWGTFNIFNNTIECGNDSSLVSPCFGNGETGNTMTVNSSNNHAITTSGGQGCSINGGSCSSVTTDLVQSLATADVQLYTSSETYAFSPTSGSGSTVGAGTNKQSICTTISGINAAAGTACLKDTTYGCSYDTGNHTVSCPSQTAVARPVTGAWDIGVYQYGQTGTPNGQTGSPNPPTNVTATVH